MGWFEKVATVVMGVEQSDDDEQKNGNENFGLTIDL